VGHNGLGLKMSKPILAPPDGAGLKSCPISTQSPLRGGENPHEAKWGGAGQARQGKIVIPNIINPTLKQKSIISFDSLFCPFFKSLY